MKRIELVFFDAGGGHRSAANSLARVIGEQKRPWDVKLLNLQELLDALDIFRKITGIRLQDLYNLALKKGWTLGSPQLTRMMHGVIRLYHPAQVRLLAAYWGDARPDLVVSVVPNFNRALFESLRLQPFECPFVTVMTDFADFPPHFWIERQQQYLVCGTERAGAQADAMGYPPDRVFRTSGMILNPAFYEVLPVNRRAERERLGLDPDLPVGLLLFGGEGSPAMARIARRLSSSGLKLQLIAICGRNEKLAAELRAMRMNMPLHVEGFTRRVAYFMQLSDFLIGKPGPGSISEALHMHLPVIVEQNAWTLPQERYNAEWIEEQRVGLVLPNFRRIDAAVARLLEPGNYESFRRNAAARNNRAVFEIPDILQDILEGNSGCVGRPAGPGSVKPLKKTLAPRLERLHNEGDVD